MRNLILISFLLVSSALYPQHRADVWYFGQNAGLIFNGETPVTVYGSRMIAEAGCATICDTTGQLLFYTNGKQVWDRQNNIMPHGDSLGGGTDFVNQNSLVIPDPGNNNQYFLFTVDSMSSGLKYSKIDISLNNGLGDVSVKNDSLLAYVAGKITAVNHCNSKDLWVIVRDMETSDFYSYLVTDTGSIYQSPVVSTTGSKILADIGMMKASPAGNTIAMTINSPEIFLELFDFDNSTGFLSNPRKIYKTDNSVSYAYGVEFSSDGKLLYISTGGQHYELLQFDITGKTEQEINKSMVNIATGNLYALQLGPDEKIYVARVNDNYLSVINYPDKKGEECGFEKRKIFLGDNICLMGLPNFNQSYFYSPSLSIINACIGDTTKLWFDNSENLDSARWIITKWQTDTTLHTAPFAIKKISEYSGDISVNLNIYHCGITDCISDVVTIHREPDINLGNDTTIQQGSTLVLDAGEEMQQYLWNTGVEDRLLTVWDSGRYWVTVGKDGCFSSDTINVYNIPASVQLPTAFSPNGDRINDTFIPRVSGTISGFQMEIYNRYGEKLWQSTDVNSGWNGKFKGAKCAADTYLWQMKYIITIGDNQKIIEKAGNVALIR